MGASNASGSADAPNTARSVVTKVRDPNPIKNFIKGGGFTGAIIRGISGAIQKSKTDKALQGTPDYQGSKSKSNVGFTNNNGGGNDNNNQPVIVKKNIGGTEVQTTQAKVQEASKTNELNANQTKIRNAKKGRTMMQVSGSQGVGKTSPNYELGKTSLLGRV